MLPRVLIAPTNSKYPLALGIRPDVLSEFIVVHDVSNEVEGEPYSRFRRVLVSDENGAQLFAVERRGYRGYTTASVVLRAYCTARELCQTRRRKWDDAAAGFAHGLDRIRRMIDLVGQDVAC